MAHLLRLIVAVLVAAFSLSVHALIPTQTIYYWTADVDTETPKPRFSDPVDACKRAMAVLQASSPASVYTYVGIRTPYTTNVVCDGKRDGTNIVYQATRVGGPGSCPANSTASGGSCACTSPFIEDPTHTSCVAPPDPCLAVKGALAQEIEWASATKGNNYGCLGGEGQLASCQTVATCDYTSQVPGQAGYTCRGLSYLTGARATMCTGTGEAPTSPAPAPVKDPVNPDKVPVPGQPAPARCPAGQAPGEFNGTRICAPTGSGTETSTPAPGNGSSTVTGPDGSSTSTTQDGRTTCVNGKCTTTTNTTNTTVNAAGNTTCPAGQTSGTTTVAGQSRTTCTGTSTASSAQAQSDFCKTNPKDKQCDGDGADTSFGGSCASGFKAVSDDAVINAMAEETFRQNCKVNPDQAETTLASAERVKTGNQTGDNPNNASLSISPGSIDTSDALGASSSCIADKTITVVGGVSVVLPLSRACDGFPMLGTLLVALSFLVAGAIILRG